MPDRNPRLIVNSKRTKCDVCKGVHDYVSKVVDKRCDVAVGYSLEVANRLSRIHANGVKDVVPVPDGMTIALDDSARRFPHRKGPSKLQRFSTVERLA